MIPKNKVILTEKQRKWLEKHYKNTKNAILCAKLGISESTLHRLAREMGLKKTKQYMRKCQLATTEAADRSHRLNGTYPPKGYRIPKSEQYQFKKGERLVDRIGKKRYAETIRKSTESRNNTIRAERRRALFGLPQKTKLRVTPIPREKILLRYYLRKRGYIVDDEKRIAYYSEETKRGKRIEAKEQPWYKFRDVNDIPKIGQIVNDINEEAEGTTGE